MTTDVIPDDVRRLILERIDSVPELEAILLFHEDPRREWTPEAAGRRLYVSTTVAGHVLGVLCERGFFTPSGDGYRYAPESSQLGEIVDRLAIAYSRHLVAVTQMIHSKPSQNLRDFVEAFRIRKPK